MSIPRATARLQFNSDFTLTDALEVVDYYADMGVSHIYASPLLGARKGSTHGYDIVDPTRVNPELGGEPALKALVAKLRQRGMGLLLDIVPNHMGVGGPENPWWLDVLEWGRQSVYAHWFDINWNAADPALTGKILLPFLGAPYGEALENGQIALRFDDATGGFWFSHHAERFPLAPSTYAQVLTAVPALRTMTAGLEAGAAADDQAAQRSHAAACAALRELWQKPEGRAALEQALAQFSADSPEGRQRLHGLLEQQHYRLTWWRNAAEEINWRRFFEVSELAGVRVEADDVFDATHACIFRLYAEGVIDGVRVDHVDGLALPAQYCRKLRERLQALNGQRPADVPGGEPYIVIEKILTGDETVRTGWKVHGTTGYEFMDQVSALLHDPAGAEPLQHLWFEVSGDSRSFDAHVQAARRQLLAENFVGEIDSLVRALHAVARTELATRDVAAAPIRRVLVELLVAFPAYRTYVHEAGREPEDQALLERALNEARTRVRTADQPLLALLARWLGGETPSSIADPAARAERLAAITRFQQLTPPLAAKSVEDTAFYRYGRLLSRNEVGGDPGRFALPAAAFHQANLQRLRDFPHTLLATATHDHKRGEDVRARLAVLSELPQAWAESVRKWMAEHQPLRIDLGGGQFAPSAPDQAMLYQMIVGAWPLELAPEDHDGLKAYAERVAVWQEKAWREAKRQTSWVTPNAAYEDGCRAFLMHLMDGGRCAPFIADLRTWVDRLALPGICNSLTQTVLRLASPGVPDLYQGAEFWDLSLVDPDNRRLVNYDARRAALAASEHQPDFDPMLWQSMQVKQPLIQRVLKLRAAEPALFDEGDYVPLQARGAKADHVVAFLRRHQGRTLLVAALRLPASGPQPGSDAWGDTVLELPQAVAQWRDVLSADHLVQADGDTLPLALVLGERPVAVLMAG
ncbi:malto-oligosyltrehalose synthase [Noviherbaspirillum suwonense]|uniref:Maltooligosyl trehalose synthase n=1 Tax=Noviherbaspirillum suwonense TaxID=1224511 RepID=A0ABY1QEP0_9BURK|nr:malto-oligosyltrehalose synthase [Noviherbaspirillum suwonense]SMP66022.1 maltooligosyl trehalose synthase [Noviherbaspirillum suwonense]